MNKRHSTRAVAAVLSTLLLATAGELAARGVETAGDDTAIERDYIVRLASPPLAARLRAQAGSEVRAQAAAPAASGKLPPARGIDLQSAESRALLRELDADLDAVRMAAWDLHGLAVEPRRRFQVALNGFTVRLRPEEAARLAATPGVASVEPDFIHRLHTDAGPRWIGAEDIWDGTLGVPARRGEGVVIGVIDSGIAWDHASFADPGQNGGQGHNHVNPYGAQKGLCSQPSVACNDKLVGVYDFVQDNPATSVTEENNNGYDNTQHGSLVASVAAGNPVQATISNAIRTISGVAPNANIIAYRVCYQGDPNDSEDDACQGSAIIDAIDQAITDGVDVINYSLGSNATSPWQTNTTLAFLEAYQAGITVVTSSGNEGPADGTVGNPGNAPWLTAVGAATHDRLIGNALGTLGGPSDLGTLFGASQTSGAVASADIVYAADYGFPLCGTGADQSQPNCAGNTGLSNPFPAGTFTGKIVVCDRGTYGRVEKGRNVQLAGAVGYVLANTGETGESIVADQHCLPATHVGREDGDRLRQWLSSGSGHRASLGAANVQYVAARGDLLGDFSSRGPNSPPAENILKPNLIAPGVAIVGAGNQPGSFISADGTSFASPHVAGAAALLKSVYPSAGPGQISSMISLTATTEQARDENGVTATPHERGAGRPRLGEAARVGLYFDETLTNFELADPDEGGDPRTLNLPSMTNLNCENSCTFTRRVRAVVAGLQWTASAAGFPDGAIVTITPQQFTLPANTSQSLQVTINLAAADVVGSWVYGEVRLATSGRPDAVIPVTLFATAGDLPGEWQINTDRDSGWQEFQLDELAAMPQAQVNGGGLVRPTDLLLSLAEDPTEDDPYDGGTGVFSLLQDVPAGALWLHAETLASPAEDLDLFVGRDDNGDGLAQAGEEVCASTTPQDIESCEIFNPGAGRWWILVQNWESGESIGNATPLDVTLRAAIVSGQGASRLTATGPGTVPGGDSFKVRVAWDDVDALPGETLLGAVGLGSSAAAGNNFGVIPVYLNRFAVADPEPLLLRNGRVHRFAMEQNEGRDQLFIDVPPGSTTLKVEVDGATAQQSNNLRLDLYREPFDQAFDLAPFPHSILMNQGPDNAFRMQSGGNGAGPEILVQGAELTPGRYYPVVRNQSSSPARLALRVDLGHDAGQLPLQRGLWQPVSRDIRQGVEYNGGANSRSVIWYTYRDDGAPTWYLASGGLQGGNTWGSDLLRYTNDGTLQDATVVGAVNMSVLSADRVVFSYTLDGESGSEILRPTSAPGCPLVSGQERSYTGLWYRPPSGLGGASVVANATAQVLIHYLYDATGTPAWLYAGGNAGATQSPLLQWKGFCPLCSGSYSNQPVGTLDIGFSSETAGSWTLDYLMATPLTGDVQRTDTITKLTARIDCP